MDLCRSGCCKSRYEPVGGSLNKFGDVGGMELSLKIESMKYDVENGYPSHAITSQTFKYYAVLTTN